MAHFGVQAMVFDEGIEVVMCELRIQLSRQHYRAKHIRVEDDPDAIELRSEKRVIEASVMRHHEAPGESSRQSDGNVNEDWRRVGVNVSLRPATSMRGSPEQRRPSIGSIAVHGNDADFGNAICRGTQACRFDIDECERFKLAHRILRRDCSRAIIERSFDNVQSFAPDAFDHFRQRPMPVSEFTYIFESFHWRQ